jgi:hypothetical protein
MSIEKSLYQAPQGLETIGPDIEIEIEDPESVTIGIDGMEIEITNEEDDFNANLVEFLDDGDLEEIVGDLIADFDDDISSRKDWIQTYRWT